MLSVGDPRWRLRERSRYSDGAGYYIHLSLFSAEELIIFCVAGCIVCYEFRHLLFEAIDQHASKEH